MFSRYLGLQNKLQMLETINFEYGQHTNKTLSLQIS